MLLYSCYLMTRILKTKEKQEQTRKYHDVQNLK